MDNQLLDLKHKGENDNDEEEISKYILKQTLKRIF